MEVNEWVIKVNNELERMADTPSAEVEHREKRIKRSIFKVADSVIDLNKKAYKPQAVSFGPYHYGEAHLMPMEEHKYRALLHFLKRSNKPLQLYVNSLAEVAQNLKDSYDSLHPAWQSDTDRFLQLMILDGCFMLEVLRTATQTRNYDYPPNDPIFSNHGKFQNIPSIKRDMLLLENQLPMQLLNKLDNIAIENAQEGDEEFVNKLILKFCCPRTRFPADLRTDQKCLHLLDAYRKSLLWIDPRWKSLSSSVRVCEAAFDYKIINLSAMELDDAGIRFKKSKTGSLNFNGGVLSLPPIVVDDATELIFLNLIALEQFHAGAGSEVASYISFIDSIIYSANDVSFLHSRGVIQNAIGTDESVVKLFKSLSKDITLDPHSSLIAVHQKVINYCEKREWRAYVVGTYFRNPWAVINVIAAIVLFFLTTAQTIYTVYPYYRSNDSP